MRPEEVQVGVKAPLGLLLAVLLLAGCAARTGETAQAPASTDESGQIATTAVPGVIPKTAVPSPARSASVLPGVPKARTEPPIDDFKQVTAQGRLRITGQCVELVTDQLNWVLIGPAAAGFHDGQQVKVVGVPDPNRETACTGSPLLVSSVVAA
jgi:hypothetical protein